MIIKLKQPAYVDGVLRNPDEGCLTTADVEGQRLIDRQLADDVTADFAEAKTSPSKPAA